MLQHFTITRVISKCGGNRLGVGFVSCSDLVDNLSQGNWNHGAQVHNCLRLGHNSILVPAGSTASGVNMKDTSNNEKMDISKDQHSEISRQAEEKVDTAPEDDGVGENSKEENEMESSDEDFREFASILKMDMKPELKGWFVKSGYKVHVAAFRERFGFLEGRGWHPLYVVAWAGAVDIVDTLKGKAQVDVNIQVGGEGDFEGGLHFTLRPMGIVKRWFTISSCFLVRILMRGVVVERHHFMLRRWKVVHVPWRYS